MQQVIGLGESATVVQDLLGHGTARHVRAAAGALPLHQVVRNLSAEQSNG